MLHLYDQEVHSDPDTGQHGDCTRACIRTVAQMDMPDLPHPIARKDEWNDEFFDALEEKYELYFKYQPCRPGKDYSFMPRVVMAAGPTVRTQKTGAHHLVVWDREAHAMIHDPHPSRAGLIEIRGYFWLTNGVQHG